MGKKNCGQFWCVGDEIWSLAISACILHYLISLIHCCTCISIIACRLWKTFEKTLGAWSWLVVLSAANQLEPHLVFLTPGLTSLNTCVLCYFLYHMWRLGLACTLSWTIAFVFVQPLDANCLQLKFCSLILCPRRLITVWSRYVLFCLTMCNHSVVIFFVQNQKELHV